MKIRFTEHAVDRFIERRMPGASRMQALQELERLAAEAIPLRERTAAGDDQALVDGIVLVLKRDRAGGRADCATVLFDCRAGDTNPLAAEIEHFGVMPLEAAAAPIPRKRRSRRANRF
jgi:hypothetical protein